MTPLLLGIGLLPLAALLQSSVLPQLPFPALRPDLMLVIVLAWNLARSHRDGLLWAFAGGLMLDTFSAGPFGALLLALFVVCLAANFIGTPLWDANPLLPLLGTVAGVALYHAIYLGVLLLWGWQLDWRSAASSVVLPAVFLDTALMLLAYPLARRIARRIAAPQVSL